MLCVVVLILFCNIAAAVRNPRLERALMGLQENQSKISDVEQESESIDMPTLHLLAESKPAPAVIMLNVDNKSLSSTIKSTTVAVHEKINTTEMESGALLRGALVLGGLGIIFLIYVSFKTYYRRRANQAIMIRKYGVRTRRSDIEMTPLPLSDDEEDETLFEVGNNKS